MTNASAVPSVDEFTAQSLELVILFFSLKREADRNRLFDMAKAFVDEVRDLE